MSAPKVERTGALRVILLYPLAVALAPILLLLAVNYGEIPTALSYRSLALALLVATGCTLLLRLLFRDWDRAAAIVTLGAVLFYSYGHLYAALETVRVLGVQLGRHRYLLPLFSFVFGLVVFWIVRSRSAGRQLTASLAPFGLTMLVFAAAVLLVRIARSRSEWTVTDQVTIGAPLGLPAGQTATPPDIYYIILDAYARADVMQDQVGYDNQEFLDWLDQQGFFVAGQSNANFMWTALSLSSSLNMRFVQDFRFPLTPGSYPAIFADPIQHSLVRYELERAGYSIVALESGYLPTEVSDADFYLRSTSDRDVAPRGLNSFEMQLASTSAGLAVTDLLGPRIYDWVGFRSNYPYDELRRIILDEFTNLEHAVSLPSPKFVFAHIVSPHSPYLFGPNGEPLEQSGPITLIGDPDAPSASGFSSGELYRDQARFITGKIQAAIDYILRHSVNPPVIVIQGDHGPGLAPDWQSPTGAETWQRFAIMNVYHLPYGCDRQLYPQITPVNSFRLILACYLNAPYDLAPDRSFFSYWPRTNPYVFIDMTANLNSDSP